MNSDALQEPVATITVGIDLIRSGYEVKWVGGEKVNGVINMPWPDYDKRLESALSETFSAIGPDYDYVENYRRIEHLEPFMMNREQLSTWITWVLRGERFSDGFIETQLKSGRLLSALERAVVILTNLRK